MGSNARNLKYFFIADNLASKGKALKEKRKNINETFFDL